MSEERKENPMKRTAINLVNMMDYQKNSYEMNDFERQLFKEEYNEFIMNEVIKKGYDVQTLLMLGEEYKTLSIKDYMEWKYI
jgi:hypothetical protein